jgi:hypothetical protein
MNTIATLQDLRQHLGLDASDTADDKRLLAALKAASDTIEQNTGRNFSPYIATLEHIPISRLEILLRDDVLEIESVIDGDGTSIPLTDISREGAVLRLKNDRSFAAMSSNARVQISGMWGYHPQPMSMWLDSTDAPVVDISATANFIVLETGSYPDGSAIFSEGQLLQIDSELIEVVSVDQGADVLTIRRGVRGSTASTHLATASIYIFQPAAAVRSLCTRRAAWLYRSADRLPEPLPEALLDEMRSLRRLSVQS